MYKILKYYIRLHRCKHLVFDLLAVIILLILFIDKKDLYEITDLSKYVQDTAKLILPVLTFQSALHATSIIFFANSSSEILQKFKDEDIFINGVQTTYKKIDQLYAYFGWAILIQLLFLLYSVMLIVSLSSNNCLWQIKLSLISALYLLLFGILYSIILCIRNIGFFFEILVHHTKK